MKRHWVTLLTAFLAFSVLLSACSSNTGSTTKPVETKKIKVISQMFTTANELQYMKESILSIFKAETGIDVDLQSLAVTTDLYKLLDAQKASGVWTTDILIAHDSTAVNDVKQYAAVEPYTWTPEGNYITQFDDNFVSNGKRYFVPLSADVYLMIANKKAIPYLDKLGYNINTLTWKQMAEWCNLIKKETGSPKFVFPAKAGTFAAYQFDSIQLAYGATYVPSFNKPCDKAAFDLISSMKDAILPSSPTIDLPINALVSEDAWISVYHQSYITKAYNLAPDKFVIAPVPMGDDGYRGTIIGGFGIGIIAASKNQEADKKFVNFMLRDDTLYNTMANTGPVIPSKQGLIDKLGTSTNDIIMKMGLQELTGKTRIDRVHSTDYNDFGQVKALYESTFNDILSGKKVDQTYLDAKQADLEKLKVSK